MPQTEDPGTATRRVVYCMVPQALAAALHESLRRHYRDEVDVEVIVERRCRERRRVEERRASAVAGELAEASRRDPAPDRRRIRAQEGRRAGERRAALLTVDPPRPLPRRARRHAAELSFVERIEPSTLRAEDIDTARLVAKIQLGNGTTDAFATLYMRYFDRVYGYLVVALNDAHEAEDLTQDVFARVLEVLPDYERRRQPFRAWLFSIVRNRAIDHLRRGERLTVTDPEELGRRQDTLGDEGVPELVSLDWITDRDLTLFIERLPAEQRQVLLLRYMLGLSTSEIAQVLGRTPNHVRVLHYRAVGFLRHRLAGVGRATRHGGRTRMRTYAPQARVLRRRRFVLLS